MVNFYFRAFSIAIASSGESGVTEIVTAEYDLLFNLIERPGNLDPYLTALPDEIGRLRLALRLDAASRFRVGETHTESGAGYSVVWRLQMMFQ